MARYFLFFDSPQGRVGDPDGIELVSLGRLHESLARVARDFMRDNPASVDWRYEVRDESGRPVLKGALKDAATEEPPPAL